MLPRLREIADQGRHDDDPVHERRVDDTRQLVTVMTVCVDKDVPLTFG